MTHTEKKNYKSIKSILNSYRHKILSSGLQKAAVIIPLFLHNNELHILFTKRSTTLSKHKGEISFPGGTLDNNDASLLECALRECEEEIGIKKDDVQILGQLDDMITTSDFVLSTFVGIIPYPYRFTINKKEVDILIEVPIKHLLQKAFYQKVSDIIYHGKKYEIHSFFYREYNIWGITGLILKNFLNVVYDF